MKKLLTIFIFSGLLLSFAPPILAYTDSEDQSNSSVATDGNSFPIDNSAKVGQSFTPSLNKLTKIILPLRNAKGNIKVEIINYQSNASLGSVTNNFPTKISNLSWQTFIFSTALNVAAGTKYVMKVFGDDEVRWYLSTSPNYSKGTTILYNPNNTVVEYGQYDMGFKTYGYNYIASYPGIGNINIPNIGTDTQGQPASNGQQSNTDTGEQGTSSGNSSSSTSTAETLKAEVDESIGVPTLSYLFKNNELIDMSVKNEISISLQDNLKILGKAPAGMKVMVFMGEVAFSNKANENGDWNVNIENKILKEGTYQIEAQTQNENGKGSKIVKLFDLKVADENKEKDALKAKADNYRKLFIYTLAGLGTVALLAGGGFVWLWRKHHKLKAGAVKPR